MIAKLLDWLWTFGYLTIIFCLSFAVFFIWAQTWPYSFAVPAVAFVAIIVIRLLNPPRL